MATASVASSSEGFSTGFLLFSTGSALIAGVSLGYVVAKRTLRGELSFKPSSRQHAKVPRLSNLASFPRSITAEDSNISSGMTTPSETPRPGSANSEVLAGLHGDVRMAVIVRQDVPLPANKVVQHSAWTVLGMFKKLYKRRDPGWKVWELTGQKLEVLLATSEDELMAVQAAARAAGLPTHTFAGKDRSRKQRTVMAVGPADIDALSHIVGGLKQL